MWPFNFKKKKDISFFYESGGRPTWKEWEKWTEEEKLEALEMASKIKTMEILVMRFTLASSLEEKLAIAEEMSKFDGGELAKEIRRQINVASLK